MDHSEGFINVDVRIKPNSLPLAQLSFFFFLLSCGVICPLLLCLWSYQNTHKHTHTASVGEVSSRNCTPQELNPAHIHEILFEWDALYNHIGINRCVE